MAMTERPTPIAPDPAPEAAPQPYGRRPTAGPAGLKRQLSWTAAVLAVLGTGWAILVRPAVHAPSEAPPASPGGEIAIPKSARQLMRIETAPVRLASVPGLLRTTGQVSFNENQTVKISPRLQGRVDQVSVQVGDRVAAGETLAILDSVDAANAWAAARQAENRLRLAHANLDRQERLYRLGTADVTQAEANLDQAKAHTRFTRDALDRTREQARIGGFTEKPVEDARQTLVGAQADLAQAQADLGLAQRQRDRAAKLFAAGVAAKQDLEAGENALAKAQVTVQADQEKTTLAQQALDREQKAFRANLYADQAIRSAESDYQQALLQQAAAVKAVRLARAAVRRDLEQARSDVEAAQEDAQSARRVLVLYGQPADGGAVRITSPIAGLVVERNVNPGQIVDQSQMTPWQMFTITNAHTVWVNADVYEKDIARVAPGQPVQVRVAALSNRRFTGVVQYVAPALDPKTHALKVRTRIANPDGVLKEGMFVDMLIRTGRSPAEVLVPLSAVQHDDQGDAVFVAAGNGFVRRAVQLGKQRGEEYVVKRGLRVGEQVATQGAIFLGGPTLGD